MPMTEDLSVYFREADFAQSATLDGSSVLGIFDNAYVTELGVAGTGPAFTLPSASVPAAWRGKALVTGGVTYTVREHQPDGTGVSVLILEAT